MLRDEVRYIRCYKEILSLKKKYKNARMYTWSYNLGESYVLGALGIKMDGPIIVSYPVVKQLFELFGIKAEIQSSRLQRLAAEGRWENILEAYSGWDENSNENYIMAMCKQFSVDKPKIWKDVFIDEASMLKANSLLKRIDANKSILISPDAQSVSIREINDKFWLKIAAVLESKGYTVLFNSNKTYGNYKSVFLDLGATIYSVRLFRAVIGLRSGLQDIFAGTSKTPIFSIYPRNDRDVSIKRWSLKNIRDDNVREVMFDGDTELLKKYIIEFIE